jgi:hypothetical protein
VALLSKDDKFALMLAVIPLSAKPMKSHKKWIDGSLLFVYQISFNTATVGKLIYQT